MGEKQVEPMGKRIFVAVILLLFFGGAATLYGKEVKSKEAKPKEKKVAVPEKVGVPEIEEVSPTWGASGMGFELVVKGKNLQRVQEIHFEPSIGIEVHNPPIITAGGTVAAVNITIMGFAPLGPRIVTVIGASGSSPAEPREGNIFKVSYAHIH